MSNSIAHSRHRMPIHISMTFQKIGVLLLKTRDLFSYYLKIHRHSLLHHCVFQEFVFFNLCRILSREIGCLKHLLKVQ